MPVRAGSFECSPTCSTRAHGSTRASTTRSPIDSRCQNQTFARCFGRSGPVAVFCASNFPLAYSVAGGDTASAFAAGCPVIVNGHIAHRAPQNWSASPSLKPLDKCDMPEGVFSLLFSSGYEIGQALVKHPAIKAVGFTGSRRGGRALMDIAAARPEPIPVYAEMSSVNPTFILPNAINERGDAIAAGLHASVTDGAGQFCTKPGLVFVPGDGPATEFAAKFERSHPETGSVAASDRGHSEKLHFGQRTSSSGSRAVHPARGRWRPYRLCRKSVGLRDERGRISEHARP